METATVALTFAAANQADAYRATVRAYARAARTARDAQDKADALQREQDNPPDYATLTAAIAAADSAEADAQFLAGTLAAMTAAALTE